MSCVDGSSVMPRLAGTHSSSSRCCMQRALRKGAGMRSRTAASKLNTRRRPQLHAPHLHAAEIASLYVAKRLQQQQPQRAVHLLEQRLAPRAKHLGALHHHKHHRHRRYEAARLPRRRQQRRWQRGARHRCSARAGDRGVGVGAVQHARTCLLGFQVQRMLAGCCCCCRRRVGHPACVR